MKKLSIIFSGLSLLLASALCLAHSTEHAGPKTETEKVEAVLNQLHQNAAKADGEAYFALFADNAVYMGTDVGERWSKDEFKSYAMPHFSKGSGWVYHKRNRHISMAKDQQTAWFDEVLDSKNYGTSRGTGVLVKTDKGWKFTQYHLTFPMPNDLAKGFTEQIKAFEAKAATAK